MKYLIILLFPAILCAVEVELSWSDNSQNESGFEIERRAPDGEFEAIATVLADVAEYTDDTAAGTYEYRVRAFNEFGYSGYTNTLKASAGDPPIDPDGLSGSQPVLSITTNADGSITVKPVNP